MEAVAKVIHEQTINLLRSGLGTEQRWMREVIRRSLVTVTPVV